MTKKHLLKTLLLLCALVVGSTSSWAQTTVTWQGSTALPGTATAVGNDQNITIQVSSTNTYTSPIRVYANTTITIKATNNAKILSVSYEASSTGSYVTNAENATVSPNADPSISGKIVTWTYDASDNVTEFTFTPSAQTRANSISVTYEAYTITAQSNNTDYGTVSLSGSVITGFPNEGYRYAAPSFTVSPENSATVVQNGNEFSVTPSTNTTVTINFEAIPTYTVTLGDDNSTLTEAIGGAGVTLPTRAALNGYEFEGWSETNVSEKTTSAPTIIPAGSYAPTTDITLYPVYTKTEGGGGTAHETASVTIADYATANSWVSGSRYTSISLDANVTAIGKDNGNNSKYYSNSPGTWRHYAGDSGEITISTTSGELTSVTITYTGNKLKYGDSDVISGTAIEVSGYSAVFSVSGTSSNSQVSAISVNYDVTNAGTTYYWSSPVEAAVATPTFSPEGGTYDEAQNVTISCETEGATIYYTTDGSDPTSSSTLYEGAIPVSLGTTTIKAIAYVGEDASEIATATYLIIKKDAELSYSQASYSVNIYDVFNSPELTNPHNLSPITYGSSDPNVAQVDADGSVSLFGSGTTTITATFGGNDEYEAGTAEYTLNVTRTSSSTIYKKVTSQDQLVEGKKYIIVCDMNSPEGIAMGVPYGSGSTAYRTRVEGLTITDGIIEITNSVVELTLGGNSTNGYTFLASDDEKYLSWTGGNYLEAADNVTTDNGATWKILETEDGFIVANVKQDKDKDNNIKDRVIMYNSNQPRFACYIGTQNPAVLYVQEPGGFEDVIMNNNDGYRTYVTTNNIDWSQTSVKGYRVSAFTKNSVTLPQLTGITKGGTPVIVKCKKGINALVVTNETETEQGTLLHPGKDATEAVKDKLYVLQRVPNSQWDENGDPYQQYNFYKLNPNRLGELQSDKEHAYLVLGETLSTSGPGFGSKPTVVSLRFINANDDDPMVSEDGGFPDGIKEVEQNASVNGEFYSISGVRVAAPTKGIYIVKGKKVLVK